MSTVIIETSVLEEARAFFEKCGAHGKEGTAMIARAENGGTRLVIPEQTAGRCPRCWVKVTDDGKLQLAVALRADERYVARIHSHPCEAFHSPTDDSNPALTQQGALSIVVPYFGLGLRYGLDGCAIYVRRESNWIELAPGAQRSRLVESAR